MEKRSKHPGDVTKWIEKVFDSCTNTTQLLAAEKLVTSFDKIYRHEKLYRIHLVIVSGMAWDRLSTPTKQLLV
jgi:hypothetical protein